MAAMPENARATHKCLDDAPSDLQFSQINETPARMVELRIAIRIEQHGPLQSEIVSD